MLNNANQTEPENPHFLTNLIDIILYDESWWILRLSTVMLVIFGWVLLGTIIFENLMSLESIRAVFWQCFRYMLAPLAALIGAYILGASYVQDIYELGKFRPALRYMWAAVFNGVTTTMFTGLVAGIVAFLLFGMGSTVIFQTIVEPTLARAYGLMTGLIFGVLFFLLYGQSYMPSLTITDGHKKIDEDEINLLDRVGGPGWLYVEPGNVVMLERLESPSEVLGAGMHFINRFHRIKDIISLKDQQVAPRNLMATTKDGIAVTVKDFQFRYRLYAGHKNHGVVKRTLRSPYPYSVQAAKNRTYNRNVRSDGVIPWDNAVQAAFDGAITGYINKNSADRVLVPSHLEGDSRAEIDKAIRAPSMRAALKNVGAELLWYDIGRFEVNAEIDTERMNAWFAKWAGNSKIIRAQGQSERIANEERGRAEVEKAMVESIIKALDDADLPNEVDDNLWNIVLVRTAQIIESMTAMQKPTPSDQSWYIDQTD